jgi:hypothetical protein
MDQLFVKLRRPPTGRRPAMGRASFYLLDPRERCAHGAVIIIGNGKTSFGSAVANLCTTAQHRIQ